MKKKSNILWLLLALLTISCASSTPIERLRRQLDKYPEYSIILEDMKEEGNFFKDYFHRYKIVYAEKIGNPDSLIYQSQISDWDKVNKREYEKYRNYLGMVLASKSRDSEVTNAQYPPGYQYVGDPRYGNWRRDERGNSFWEFYGKYAFFSHMFGMFGRPIYRSDWNTYRDYRSRGTPYYGPNREYGTNGSYTKHTNKSFFERRKQKELAKKARFSQRVKNRARRSRMSGLRRRSGGFGK
ncbi:MAG: hypothetical protein ACE5JB_00925 [bacterium]